MEILIKLVLTMLGGGAVLETTLENHVMPHVPVRFRGIVTGLISFAVASVVAMLQGKPVEEALATGMALWGTAVSLHNNPMTTSGDWALPPPPKTADGVPGNDD